MNPANPKSTEQVQKIEPQVVEVAYWPAWRKLAYELEQFLASRVLEALATAKDWRFDHHNAEYRMEHQVGERYHQEMITLNHLYTHDPANHVPQHQHPNSPRPEDCTFGWDKVKLAVRISKYNIALKHGWFRHALPGEPPVTFMEKMAEVRAAEKSARLLARRQKIKEARDEAWKLTEKAAELEKEMMFWEIKGE